MTVKELLDKLVLQLQLNRAEWEVEVVVGGEAFELDDVEPDEADQKVFIESYE